MKRFLFLLLLIPVSVFAQDAGEFMVAGERIAYDRAVETDTSTLYFMEDDLVASKSDGVTLVYSFDRVVTEAHDTDGDGELDVFLAIDKFDQIESISGPNADRFERPAIVTMEELLENEGSGSEAAAPDDLVGNLDSIKIPGKAFPWIPVIIVILAAVGGYRYYKKRKLAEAEL